MKALCGDKMYFTWFSIPIKKMSEISKWNINCHVEGSVTEQFAVPSKSIHIASMMEYVDVN